VDAAIDFGIAMEAVFLEDNDRDEITYRLTMRAGRFLGSDLASRQAARRLFSGLYDLRSKAAHRAAIPESVKNVPAEYALLGYGYAQLRGTMRAILEEGKWPDWNELLLA
jgi:hypothetical protein